MINVKDRRRSICVAALALLMLIAVSLLPFFPYETWAEGIDTKAITEEELSGIQREIESLYDSGTIIDAINEKQAEISGIQLMSEEIEKTVTISNVKILYDFNEKPTYLLTEFEDGGYAIRFREGETFVERNESFNSIYTTENVIEHRCYYAGPGQYFYKRDGKTYEVRTGQEVIFDKSGDDEIEEINRQIVEEKQSGIMPMSIVDEGYTLLNFNKKEMDMNDLIRGLYFYGMDEYYNEFVTLLRYGTWTNEHDNKCIKFCAANNINAVNANRMWYYNIGGNDLLFGENIYGSCALVAIGMVLQFYDRTGWCDVVPSNTDAWENIQYEYPYPQYFSKHSRLNPSKMEAERLHQYLISLAHPGVLPSDSYGTSEALQVEVINKYAENLGYSNKIVGGSYIVSPILLHMIIGELGYPFIFTTRGATFDYKYAIKDSGGNISYKESTARCHAVVGYGYKGSEFLCHFGWMCAGYSTTLIHENYIRAANFININDYVNISKE